MADMTPVEQVKARLGAATAQLGREMAHEGGLPDCAFEVSVKDGVIAVLPLPTAKPTPKAILTSKED